MGEKAKPACPVRGWIQQVKQSSASGKTSCRWLLSKTQVRADYDCGSDLPSGGFMRAAAICRQSISYTQQR